MSNLVRLPVSRVFILCMDRPKLGGAAGVMAAVATAVAALGAAVPAAAADGAPVPSDVAEPAAVEAVATGIVEQAAETTDEIAAAPASPPSTAAEVGQYQPEEPQYHDEEGQYHEPTPVPQVQDPPVPERSAPDASTANTPPAQAPVNVNIAVRVLSPGNDGAVSQGTSGTPSAVGGQAATAGGTNTVAVTVNVNVTANWNVIWTTANDHTWYHPTDRQYHDPQQIASQIIGQVSPEQLLEIPELPQEAESATLDRAVPWHRVRDKGGRDITGSGRGKRDATGHPRGLGRGHSATWPVVVAAPPSAAWESIAEERSRPTPRGGERHAAASRPTPAPPLPQTPPTPQALGAAAAGGGAFSTFMSTLAVLVAALALAALRSARRLGLPTRRLQEADGPRPEKPG